MANEGTQLIEIKLDDGSTYKGATEGEVITSLSQAKVNASKAIKETSDKYEAEKAEREKISAELEALKAENEKLKTPPVTHNENTNSKDFSKETYYQLLTQDPIKANRYLLRYDLGLEKEEDVPQTFMEMRQQIQNVSQQVDVFTQQSVTAAFLSQNPDYPVGNMEAAQKLSKKVEELVKSGIPYNAVTVEFAYHQLLKSEDIKPLDLTEEANKTEVTEQPNPALSGSTQINIAEVQKAENMSDKDLYALLVSKGMIK